MAFPRKNTRRLSVDGISYEWHLNEDWDRRTRWIVVRREACGAAQLLMVNPYHHDLLPSRGTVSKAVRFALGHGWRPEHKGPPVRLTFAGREHGFKVVAREPNPVLQATAAPLRD
jgi:hypothetical protein